MLKVQLFINILYFTLCVTHCINELIENDERKNRRVVVVYLIIYSIFLVSHIYLLTCEW